MTGVWHLKGTITLTDSTTAEFTISQEPDGTPYCAVRGWAAQQPVTNKTLNAALAAVKEFLGEVPTTEEEG